MSLRVLDLSGGKVKDDGLEFLVTAARRSAKSGSRVARSPTRACTVLARSTALQTLDLSNTAITDCNRSGRCGSTRR